MTNEEAVMQLVDQPAIDTVAKPLGKAVRAVYERGGEAGLQIKNAMHGVPLGHPLHPVFTDIPIGAWTTALVLDGVAKARRDGGMERAADVAIAVGLAGAAGAAITGLTDWSETDGRARRTGLVHGLLNIAATSLFAAAYVLRRKGERSRGQSCAAAGYAVAIGSAWLGGNLVYSQRLGVTHAVLDGPEEFTNLGSSAELPDGSMRRVERHDGDVLLVRQHGKACALAHSCAHLGGPLSEGELKDGSVVCPWHGSEFALHDGHVINGPATQDQPTLEVRESGGQIEGRLRQ
jgi:nitrite reductase/ring-hydroxylating ferredoxin subunit/uncharacterized membrane protein